jgi:hypothetical protein
MQQAQPGDRASAVYNSLIQLLGSGAVSDYGEPYLRDAAAKLVAAGHVGQRTLRSATREGLLAAGLSIALADDILSSKGGSHSQAAAACTRTSSQLAPYSASAGLKHKVNSQHETPAAAGLAPAYHKAMHRGISCTQGFVGATFPWVLMCQPACWDNRCVLLHGIWLPTGLAVVQHVLVQRFGMQAGCNVFAESCLRLLGTCFKHLLTGLSPAAPTHVLINHRLGPQQLQLSSQSASKVGTSAGGRVCRDCWEADRYVTFCF